MTTDTFRVFDIKLFWNDNGELQFQVHWKAKQKLKYLNKGSTYTNATFNAIPIRIFNRFTILTSRKIKDAQMRIDEKYQGYANALTKDGLALKIFLNLE